MSKILTQLPEYIYTGKIQPKPGEKDKKGRLHTPYLPSDEIIEAVNLAIHLKRPLLLKGEPGCGKTKLAQAVAYELNAEFEPWYIKSITNAQDGLYTYDHGKHLRYTQLASTNNLPQKELKRINNPDIYITYGPIGKAFLNEKQTVLLIDEIDKADIDFPNDLLFELEENRMIIKEKDYEEKSAKQSPIVFITSNDEKDLPDAFLRRCLFLYIEFPDQNRLEKIVKSHFPGYSKSLIKKATSRFLELREQMKIEKGFASKKISTSELIDWLRVLSMYPEDNILKSLKSNILAPSILLKNWDDHRRFLLTKQLLLKEVKE